MFYTEVPEDEALYDKIIVDKKAFYRRKTASSNTKTPVKRQKRYSDQFKDPVFERKEIVRKLNMIKNFREKNGDLDCIIDRWRDCIYECISTLNMEYEIPPAVVFKTFNLRKYGFSYESFGIEPGDEGVEEIYED